MLRIEIAYLQSFFVRIGMAKTIVDLKTLMGFNLETRVQARVGSHPKRSADLLILPSMCLRPKQVYFNLLLWTPVINVSHPLRALI